MVRSIRSISFIFFLFVFSFFFIGCEPPGGNSAKEQKFRKSTSRVSFEGGLTDPFNIQRVEEPSDDGSTTIGYQPPSGPQEQSNAIYAASAIGLIIPASFVFNIDNPSDYLRNALDIKSINLETRTANFEIPQGVRLRIVVLLYEDVRTVSNFTEGTPFQIGQTAIFDTFNDGDSSLQNLLNFKLYYSTPKSLAGLDESISRTNLTMGGALSSKLRLRLKTPPIHDVKVKIFANPSNEAGFALGNPGVSGATSELELVFTPLDWNRYRQVSIYATEEEGFDGKKSFMVERDISSDDSRYAAENPVPISYEVYGANEAGFFINPISKMTDEAQNQIAEFEVSLTSKPDATVDFTLTTEDNSEGKFVGNTHSVPQGVAQSDMETVVRSVNPADWKTPLRFSIRGQDDTIADGDVSYSVKVDASSDDPDYANLSTQRLFFQNEDNEGVPQIVVEEISSNSTVAGSSTAIGIPIGGEKEFRLSLNPAPSSPVKINIQSDIDVKIPGLAKLEIDGAEVSADVKIPQITFSDTNNSHKVKIIHEASADIPYDVSYRLVFLPDASSLYQSPPIQPFALNLKRVAWGPQIFLPSYLCEGVNTPATGVSCESDSESTLFPVRTRLSTYPGADSTVDISADVLDSSGNVIRTDSLGNFNANNWNQWQDHTMDTIADSSEDDVTIQFYASFAGGERILLPEISYQYTNLTPSDPICHGADIQNISNGNEQVVPTTSTETCWKIRKYKNSLAALSQPPLKIGQPSEITLWRKQKPISFNLSFFHDNITILNFTFTHRTDGGLNNIDVQLPYNPGAGSTINNSGTLSGSTGDEHLLTLQTRENDTKKEIIYELKGDYSYNSNNDLGRFKKRFKILLKDVSDVNDPLEITSPNSNFCNNAITSCELTEYGLTQALLLKLNYKPPKDSTVDVDVSADSNGTNQVKIFPASLSFTAENWDRPQAILFTPADDGLADGRSFDIFFSAVETAPGTSSSRGNKNIEFTVKDNDDPNRGITTSENELSFWEYDDIQNLNVQLNTDPVNNSTAFFEVTTDVSSALEVTPNVIDFTYAGVSQTITITPIDNNTNSSGPVTGHIILNPKPSNIGFYGSRSAQKVIPVTIFDDESFAASIRKPDEIAQYKNNTFEIGELGSGYSESVRIPIVLEGRPKPDDNILVQVGVSNSGEAKVEPNTLIFNTSDWNTPKFVTLSSKKDQRIDFDQTFDVEIQTRTEKDGLPLTRVRKYGGKNFDGQYPFTRGGVDKIELLGVTQGTGNNVGQGTGIDVGKIRMRFFANTGRFLGEAEIASSVTVTQNSGSGNLLQSFECSGSDAQIAKVEIQMYNANGSSLKIRQSGNQGQAQEILTLSPFGCKSLSGTNTRLISSGGTAYEYTFEVQ